MNHEATQPERTGGRGPVAAIIEVIAFVLLLVVTAGLGWVTAAVDGRARDGSWTAPSD